VVPFLELLAFVFIILVAALCRLDEFLDAPRLRNFVLPWVNRIDAFFAAQNEQVHRAKLTALASPPAAYWPPPIDVPEGLDQEEVPHDYLCGISMGVMRLPASTPTGECPSLILFPRTALHVLSRAAHEYLCGISMGVMRRPASTLTGECHFMTLFARAALPVLF
jgi:hypothetical protein